MSEIAICPTCGSKSKIKEKNGEVTYQAVQDEDAFKKIGQMKKAMDKFKTRAEKLEKELATLKSNLK
jgi:acetyl-CoA carboxylase beta subunit